MEKSFYEESFERKKMFLISYQIALCSYKNLDQNCGICVVFDESKSLLTLPGFCPSVWLQKYGYQPAEQITIHLLLSKLLESVRCQNCKYLLQPSPEQVLTARNSPKTCYTSN